MNLDQLDDLVDQRRRSQRLSAGNPVSLEHFVDLPYWRAYDAAYLLLGQVPGTAGVVAEYLLDALHQAGLPTADPSQPGSVRPVDAVRWFAATYPMYALPPALRPLLDVPPTPAPPSGVVIGVPAPVKPSKPRLSNAEVERLLSDPDPLSREAFKNAGGKDGQFREWAPRLVKEGKRTPIPPGPRPKVPE